MSVFVTRSVAAAGGKSMQDRADVFARGETAVLCVADGAGGVGDGAAAADRLLERVRDAVLDPAFDLLRPSEWQRLFAEVDRALAGTGETTAVVVVLAPGILLHAAAGDSEAWIVRPAEHGSVERLTAGVDRARLGTGRARPTVAVRAELDGRLIAASDGLFRHVSAAAIEATARAERFGAVGDALIALACGASGELPDDIAILVADR